MIAVDRVVLRKLSLGFQPSRCPILSSFILRRKSTHLEAGPQAGLEGQMAAQSGSSRFPILKNSYVFPSPSLIRSQWLSTLDLFDPGLTMDYAQPMFLRLTFLFRLIKLFDLSLTHCDLETRDGLDTLHNDQPLS
jgi:hypothetical protein